MSGQEFTVEDLNQMDFSPEELDAMDAAAKPAPAPLPPGAVPMPTLDESALYRANFSKDVGQAVDALKNSMVGRAATSIGGAVADVGRGLGQFAMGSGKPLRVMNAERRQAPDGTIVERYSDGNWYPVDGVAAPQPAAPQLQPIEVIHGVKYQLIDGKYKRVN